VQFYDWGYKAAQLTSSATSIFKFAKDLHANSVAITIPFILPSLHANTVVPGTWTPSPSAVGTVVKLAENQGLSVMLRPLADETNLRPSWRGAFSPAIPSKWFQSYLLFLTPYLQMAQTDKVTTFDLGSELESTYSNSLWSSLITIAGDYFRGAIEVTGSWGKSGTVAMKNASLGIDAYLPVAAPPTASVATLLAGWNANLAKNSFPAADSTTTLTEVGIPSQNGAYYQPNNSKIVGKPLNPKIQANWFTAACEFVKSHKMKGIYFWRLSISQSPAEMATASMPTLFNSSSETAIKACFKSL